MCRCPMLATSWLLGGPGSIGVAGHEKGGGRYWSYRGLRILATMPIFLQPPSRFYLLPVQVHVLSRVRLCDPMDCSPPSSSVHGVLQARILERVAIPFSRGSSRSSDWTQVSCMSCVGRQILYHKCHMGSHKDVYLNHWKIFLFLFFF